MIYLDHAATSWPKPPEVLDELRDFLEHPSANAGRGSHEASVRSTRLVFETREILAKLLGVPRARDLVFTRGATEGLNLVLKGFLKPGDRVLVSPMEHNSVMRPLARMQAERGVEFETLPSDPMGRIDLEETERLISSGGAALVAVTHGSNVNGVVQDLEGLRQAVGDTPLLVDAAQTAGVLDVNVRSLGIDFLAFSAHKGILGPTGVGGCYISPKYDVAPLCEGGTGSQSESLEHPVHRPDRYESGTLNLHGIAGVRGALRGFEERGPLGEHKRALTSEIIDGLKGIEGVRLVSPDDGTALLASFCLDNMHSTAAAERLDRDFGVLCRPGLHCSPCAHRRLGTFPEGTVRFSPGWGTTSEDVRNAVDAVRTITSS